MEQNSYKAFRTIILYTAFIILGPIVTFFGMKCVFFEGLLGMGNTFSNVSSAILAIVVVHVALGMYIYKAYFEAETSKITQKID